MSNVDVFTEMFHPIFDSAVDKCIAAVANYVGAQECEFEPSDELLRDVAQAMVNNAVRVTAQHCVQTTLFANALEIPQTVALMDEVQKELLGFVNTVTATLSGEEKHGDG